MSNSFLYQLLLHNKSSILSPLMAEKNQPKNFVAFESIGQLGRSTNPGRDQLLSARGTHASVVSWWSSWVSWSRWPQLAQLVSAPCGRSSSSRLAGACSWLQSSKRDWRGARGLLGLESALAQHRFFSSLLAKVSREGSSDGRRNRLFILGRSCKVTLQRSWRQEGEECGPFCN